MNGATEICDTNGSQTKIYHQSKQHEEKALYKLTRKINLSQDVGVIFSFNQNLWKPGSETR